jgi:hypothetical protein
MAGDELARQYGAKKLEVALALIDYQQADRNFMAKHGKLVEILVGQETVRSADLPELSAILEFSKAWQEQREKGQRLDELSRELGVLLQELNAPPKEE